MKAFFSIFALFVMSAPTLACQFKPRTDAELLEASKTVFRARIVEAKLAMLKDPSDPKNQVEVVVARYEIKEVFKGSPAPDGIVRDMPFGPGNCSLGLSPGTEYVLFPGEYDMVLLPTGSFGYFNAEGTQIKPRLDAIRKLASDRKK